MPGEFVDARLGRYLQEFLDDAAAQGRPVLPLTLRSLRVVKFVDDIAAEKLRFGQTQDGHDDDTVGSCADLDETRTLDAGQVKWQVKKYSWKEVWISSAYAHGPKPLPEIALKELVYHELGHCLLGLGHATGEAHAIMSPAMKSDAPWLRDNWGGLVAALFKQGP